jgi:hypothetical protein
MYGMYDVFLFWVHVVVDVDDFFRVLFLLSHRLVVVGYSFIITSCFDKYSFCCFLFFLFYFISSLLMVGESLCKSLYCTVLSSESTDCICWYNLYKRYPYPVVVLYNLKHYSPIIHLHDHAAAVQSPQCTVSCTTQWLLCAWATGTVMLHCQNYTLKLNMNQWSYFLPAHFSFPLTVIIIQGWDSRPICSAGSTGHSHPTLNLKSWDKEWVRLYFHSLFTTYGLMFRYKDNFPLHLIHAKEACCFVRLYSG